MITSLELKSIFKEALDATISNYSDQVKLEVGEFILNITSQYKSYMMVTDAGAATIADDIFSSETNRDFVLSLYYHLIPRITLGNPVNELKHIIECISFATCIDTNIIDISDPEKRQMGRMQLDKKQLIPSEIINRAPNKEEIFELLQCNVWLIIPLLIILYISVEDFKVSDS